MDSINFSQLINQITDNHMLALLLFLAVLMLVIFFSQGKIKHYWLNLKTRYRLNRLGYKQLLNLHCPDGLGYHFTIDRLVLRHDGISLLVNKSYPGKIFCADNIDDWTQMVGQKSYRFKNPLYELECQVKAVSACVPDIPINGYLFFDHQTEFPKGQPERVIHLKHIPQELLKDKQHEVEARLLSAWEKLQAMQHG